MTPIYFQYIDTYLVSHLPNFQIQTNETNLVPLSEREWVSFAGYLYEDHKGVQNPYLHIFQQVAEGSELINNLFDKRSALGKDEQVQLNQIALTTQRNLIAKGQDLLRKFRWLTGLKFDLNLKGKHIPIQWSRDRINWESVTFEMPKPNIFITGFFGHEPTSVFNKELLDSLIAPNINLVEPLGHDLLIEANRLYDNNDYRGAFLIGFSALEVGVKEFIAKKIPQTKWLMAYSPSPDMLKMCGQYLPELDKRLSIEGKIEKRLIGKFMESRNALAHRGEFTNNEGTLLEDSGTIIKKLKMVEYMLYRFDYCAGLDRALLYAEAAKSQMENVGLVDVPKK